MSYSLPDRMQVVEISRPGGPEVLKVATRPLPRLKPGEVLIHVAAAGINRPDCFQRSGIYPPPPGHTDLPGLEVAGTVVECAADVKQWKPGDQVCALTPGGGYAQVLRCACRPLSSATTRFDADRGCVLAGNHVHGLDQCLRARAIV